MHLVTSLSLNSKTSLLISSKFLWEKYVIAFRHLVDEVYTACFNWWYFV